MYSRTHSTGRWIECSRLRSLCASRIHSDPSASTCCTIRCCRFATPGSALFLRVGIRSPRPMLSPSLPVVVVVSSTRLARARSSLIQCRQLRT